MQTTKANNAMHTIQQDTLRNTITINIKGLFTEGHAEDVHARLERILPELKPGFTLINDLSEFENIEDGVRKLIKKSMDLINSHNPSRIIRIVPDFSKDIGFNILSLFHYSRDVKIITLKSADEARGYLDQQDS
jgi:hypothetical protein